MGGTDIDAHGTHVCGVIGARPNASSAFAGLAPGVDLFCIRVFPSGQGANQGDIADAIDQLSRHNQVDLINLSLGATTPSQIEHDAILDALDQGTLCICAAGNSAGPVEYPAAFRETVAVSALGFEGWGPNGTLTATHYPEKRERYGNDRLYLANFSCFGQEIECSALGVGIIAPVPERFGLVAPSGAMDGTSMASPAACGALAARLAVTPDYQSLQRDLLRAEKAHTLLREHSRDLGLAPYFQGRGIL